MRPHVHHHVPPAQPQRPVPVGPRDNAVEAVGGHFCDHPLPAGRRPGPAPSGLVRKGCEREERGWRQLALAARVPGMAPAVCARAVPEAAST